MKKYFTLAALALLAVALPLAIVSCSSDSDDEKDTPVVPLTEDEAWTYLGSYWELTPPIGIIDGSSTRGKIYMEQIRVNSDRTIEVEQLCELNSDGSISNDNTTMGSRTSVESTLTPATEGDYSSGTIQMPKGVVIEYRKLTTKSCEMRMQGKTSWSKAKKIDTAPLVEAARQKILGTWKVPITSSFWVDYADDIVLIITPNEIGHIYHVKKDATGTMAEYANKWIRRSTPLHIAYSEFSWDGYPCTLWYYNDPRKSKATEWGYVHLVDDTHLTYNRTEGFYTRTKPVEEEILDLSSKKL